MKTAWWSSVTMVVAVVLIGVVALGASQTFVNDTGKTVTGITITFSTAVMITDYDHVFPEQSPTGRSDKFTFSGGKLDRFGRFTISWVPSPARITAYKWIIAGKTAESASTTSAPPAAGTTATGLPDPNTPPILYGNNYPGPDEPVYHPKPGEKFWLTDLEGHGDIYDNDGIRINFAPGIDKSTIKRIEWYRNGVYLPFLTNKLEITNAEMKTFTGLPGEYSPASHHTDHAIMGYEYRAAITTTDGVWMIGAVIKSGFRWRPKEIWAELGISWSWDRIDYTPFDKIVEFLKYLKHDGFTGISIDLAYYLMTPYDTNILEIHFPDPKITTGGGIVNPTPARLEKLLKAAMQAGMAIRVRGHIYISQEYQDKHGPTFGGQIYPTNPEKFFDNYADAFFKLVPLFNKYHVKEIAPFVEMNSIKRYPGLIKKFYDRLGAITNSDLGFDEGVANMLNGVELPSPIETEGEFAEVVKNYTFWNWESRDGRRLINGMTIWTPKVETQRDQRVSVMERNFVKFLNPAVDYYRSTYPGVGLMFGEIGAYNADGFVLGLKYYDTPPNQRVMDEQERADYILAALRGAKALNISGVNLWGDFRVGDWAAPAIGSTRIMTGHYDRPASPIYRVFTAIIKPEK